MREREQSAPSAGRSGSPSGHGGVGKQSLVETTAASGGSIPRTPAVVSTVGITTPTGVAFADEPRLTRLLGLPRIGMVDPIVGYLLTLDLTKALEELLEAVGCGYARQLEARVGAFPLLNAALLAAELANKPLLEPAHPVLSRAAVALDGVPHDQQLSILAWMLARKGIAVEATTLVEGVVSLREAGIGRDESDVDDDDDEEVEPSGVTDHGGTLGDQINGSIAAVNSTGAGLPAPINPLKWQKPRRQPGGFYVGNAAHDGIAKRYEAEHLGDILALNTISLGRIVGMFRKMGERPAIDALDSEDRALKPDILNLTRKHVYEIKPASAQREAAFKARMYRDRLELAGIKVELGPYDEPGTSGELPAPGGVFQFACPEAGVITYRYSRGKRLVPVPVPFARKTGARSKTRRFTWVLQPVRLTPAQKGAIVTTTVGGAALLIVMILLAPVGV